MVGQGSSRTLPAQPFPSSIFLDKNRRGIGKSQSKWTASTMETPGSPPTTRWRGSPCPSGRTTPAAPPCTDRSPPRTDTSPCLPVGSGRSRRSISRSEQAWHTGVEADNGIDHKKNWLRFSYGSTLLRSHDLPSHPHALPPRSLRRGVVPLLRVRAGDAEDDEGLAIALRRGHCARFLKASWKFFYAFLEALEGVLQASSRPKRVKIAPRWTRNALRAKFLGNYRAD